jgi:hypothetical protein
LTFSRSGESLCAEGAFDKPDLSNNIVFDDPVDLTVPTGNLIWARRRPAHTGCKSDVRAIFSGNNREAREVHAAICEEGNLGISGSENWNTCPALYCAKNCYVQAAHRSQGTQPNGLPFGGRSRRKDAVILNYRQFARRSGTQRPGGVATAVANAWLGNSDTRNTQQGGLHLRSW